MQVDNKVDNKYNNYMKKLDLIISFLKKKHRFLSSDIQNEFKISRAMSGRYIKQLIDMGLIVKYHKSKGSYYIWKRGRVKSDIIKESFENERLNEDEITKKLLTKINLEKNCNKNTYEIVQYSMNEMINNVIDHSHTEKLSVEVSMAPYTVKFRVRDFGVGVFNNIKKKFKLNGVDDAVSLLLKGKTTTMEKRHSGQGIFFTMKFADRFEISSYGTCIISSIKDGLQIESCPKKKGTDVLFEISRNTKRSAKRVFDEFAGEQFDLKFEKTRVFVSLGKVGRILSSRSEARRILLGCNKFSVIEFDFKNVKGIGQGFAHEIFTVFANDNTNKKLVVKNADKNILSMVKYSSSEENPPQIIEQ